METLCGQVRSCRQHVPENTLSSLQSGTQCCVDPYIAGHGRSSLCLLQPELLSYIVHFNNLQDYTSSNALIRKVCIMKGSCGMDQHGPCLSNNHYWTCHAVPILPQALRVAQESRKLNEFMTCCFCCANQRPQEIACAGVRRAQLWSAGNCPAAGRGDIHGRFCAHSGAVDTGASPAAARRCV